MTTRIRIRMLSIEFEGEPAALKELLKELPPAQEIILKTTAKPTSKKKTR